jgi:hypothetical protein
MPGIFPARRFTGVSATLQRKPPARPAGCGFSPPTLVETVGEGRRAGVAIQARTDTSGCTFQSRAMLVVWLGSSPKLAL